MDTIIPSQFSLLILRGDFLLKTQDSVVCATMYNNGYEGDRYAVGTL